MFSINHKQPIYIQDNPKPNRKEYEVPIQRFCENISQPFSILYISCKDQPQLDLLTLLPSLALAWKALPT